MQTDVSRKVSRAVLDFICISIIGSCRLDCSYGQLGVGTVSRSETEWRWQQQNTTHTNSQMAQLTNTTTHSNVAELAADRRRPTTATTTTVLVLGNIYISIAVTLAGEKRCLLSHPSG